MSQCPICFHYTENCTCEKWTPEASRSPERCPQCGTTTAEHAFDCPNFEPPTRLQAEQDIMGWRAPECTVTMRYEDGHVQTVEGTLGVIDLQYDPTTGALAMASVSIVIGEES